MTRGVVVLAAALVLHAILCFAWPATGIGGARAWAFSPLRFVPVLWSLAFYAVWVVAALGVLLIVPRRRSWAPSVGIAGSLAFVGAASLLHILYPFLGDNHLRVAEAVRGQGSANEAGLIAFYHAAIGLGAAVGIDDPVQVFRIVSIACGFFFSWIVWQLAGRFEPGRRALVWSLVLGGGASFLFFGHVEVYPPLLLVLVLAISLTVQASPGSDAREGPAPDAQTSRRPLALYAWPLVVLGLAVYLHRLAILWAPAVLVGLLVAGSARVRNTRLLAPRAIGWASLALLVLGCAAAFFWSRSTTLFLRWVSTDTRPYSVLSAAHLADYANAALLGATGCALLLPLALRRFFAPPRNDVRTEERTTSAGTLARGADGATIALFLAWFIPAAALFVFNPVLGAADVDLLVLPAPFALLFGVRVLTRNRPQLRSPLAVALALNVLTSAPWMLLQRGNVSIGWFRETIHADRADYYQTHPPSLHLSFVLATNGLERESGDELRRGLKEHPEDPRFPFGLAAHARERGDWEAAESWAAAAYRVERGYLPALDLLFDAYRRLDRREEQYYAGKTIVEAHRENPEAVERYLSRERLDEIQRELKRLESR